MMRCKLVVIGLIVFAGCGTISSVYTYRVMTGNCNCEEYRTADKVHNVRYLFRAHYRMNHGIVTSIEVEIMNRSRDTLFLNQGTAKISSRNISYQYNDKSLPLPHLVILPSGSDVVYMTGSDISGSDDWNKIAGEQLTLTLQGIRLGERMIAPQQVTFVPVNPKIHQ